MRKRSAQTSKRQATAAQRSAGDEPTTVKIGDHLSLVMHSPAADPSLENTRMLAAELMSLSLAASICAHALSTVIAAPLEAAE